MLNSTLIRAFFGALILCAPALAINPQDVIISLGGGAQVEPFHYAVYEGQLMFVSASARVGDLIWIYASPINKVGEVDESIKITVLLDKAVNGKIYGWLKIPAGLAGQSFALQAVAGTSLEDLATSTTVRVDVKALHQSTDPIGGPVLSPAPPATDPAQGAGVLAPSKQDLQKDVLE